MAILPADCLNLADRAFIVGNYQEAYNYYSKVHEQDGASYKAIFRKGLCAAYVSEPTKIRTVELKAGYKLAETEIDKLTFRKSLDQTLLCAKHTMARELTDYALTAASGLTIMTTENEFAGKTDVDTYIQSIQSVTNMLLLVNELLDMSYASHKKKILSCSMDLCDSVINASGSYTYTDEDYEYNEYDNHTGRTSQKSTAYKIKKCVMMQIAAARRTAADYYSNLPSCRHKAESPDAESPENCTVKHEDCIREYKNKVSIFWYQNDKKRKGYQQIKYLAALFMALGILVSLVVMVYLPLLGAAGIPIIIVITLRSTAKRLDKYENAAYSVEMLERKAKSKESAAFIASVKKTKKQSVAATE